MIIATTSPQPQPATEIGSNSFRWRNPAGTRTAALVRTSYDAPAMQVGDTLTGYGRPDGYESFANARRAAFMLSRGESRAAAGVYQQGSRFYVRAMGTFVPGSGTAQSLLHFEGVSNAMISGLQDPRLKMLVDGSTRLFAASR